MLGNGREQDSVQLEYFSRGVWFGLFISRIEKASEDRQLRRESESENVRMRGERDMST